MLGYVYVMSNAAMPGLYKVGCTSRNPSERASDLYSTGVPAPFVVEYCVYIEDYAYIERIAHSNLSNCNYSKEFFRCDLEKCIIEVKRAAASQPTYKEWYRDQQMKARVEGREAQYLRELEEKRRREQIARAERERRARQEAEAARVEREKREKERVERDRQRREKENSGCLWSGGIILFGLLLGNEEHSFWPFIISIIIGFWVYNSFTKNDDIISTSNTRNVTHKESYYARNYNTSTNYSSNSKKEHTSSSGTANDTLVMLSVAAVVFCIFFYIIYCIYN